MTGYPLLVSHVPKTAGTSLRRMIASQWPDTVFIYNGELSLLNPDLDYIQQYRRRTSPLIVMGHYSFGVHRFLAVAPRYAIVLREPIARVISLYRHQISLPESNFTEFFESKPSLYDFVRSGITEMTNNHMCRMIAGVPPDSGKFIHGRWLLEHAYHNLRSFYTLVGIRERMNVFVENLSKMNGVPGLTLPVENVSTGVYPTLDEVTRKLLLDMNALDCELYESVRRSLG